MKEEERKRRKPCFLRDPVKQGKENWFSHDPLANDVCDRYKGARGVAVRVLRPRGRRGRGSLLRRHRSHNLSNSRQVHHRPRPHHFVDRWFSRTDRRTFPIGDECIFVASITEASFV